MQVYGRIHKNCEWTWGRSLWGMMSVILRDTSDRPDPHDTMYQNLGTHGSFLY